jgi:hypothetical protein
MSKLRVRLGTIGPRAAEQAPDGGAAVAILGFGANGVTSLEREVLLHRVNGREVVIFGLAELEEAIKVSMKLVNESCRGRLAYFSQDFGA